MSNPTEENAPPAAEITPVEAALAENVAAAVAAEEPAEPEEDINSKKVTLADLSAKGTALYAHKKYEDASEFFSEASGLQAELNGETAPENAEILFHYGRCLFKVGQSKSNVLGGAAPAEKKQPKPKPAAEKPAVKAEGSKDAAAFAADAAEGGKADGGADEKKPLFQFTGDENFEESDEEEQAEGDEEEDDEDDELLVAFEVLDLARVCYEKQLEQIQQQEAEGADKGKEAEQDNPTVRHIKERLADTHDALAEISLENEKYPNAIEDGRTSLQYKLGLYPEDSEIIAEAHFKLSLALEFASVTTTSVAAAGQEEEGAAAPPAEASREDMDQGLRDEAIKEMELALKSFKLKLQNKEVELATMASPDDNELARKSITEMKDVIADMEQRLVDLKNGPIDTKGLLGGDSANPLGGLFGAKAGESATETQARVDEAKKTATDLTGLVRKKKAVAGDGDEAAAADAAASSGKRKASGTAPEGSESPKKAKVDDEA